MSEILQIQWDVEQSSVDRIMNLARIVSKQFINVKYYRLNEVSSAARIYHMHAIERHFIICDIRYPPKFKIYAGHDKNNVIEILNVCFDVKFDLLPVTLTRKMLKNNNSKIIWIFNNIIKNIRINFVTEINHFEEVDITPDEHAALITIIIELLSDLSANFHEFTVFTY